MDLKWFLFSIDGRVNRKPFWLYALSVFIISFGAAFVFASATTANPNTVSLVLTLVFLWPNICVQAKRWHDRDKSAWWILINLIPIVGPIWALVETGIFPGTPGENRFGADPLGGFIDGSGSSGPSAEIDPS
jgi:uncharacterized membrane protein YhaH (DUF805 family)